MAVWFCTGLVQHVIFMLFLLCLACKTYCNSCCLKLYFVGVLCKCDVYCSKKVECRVFFAATFSQETSTCGIYISLC